MDLNKLKVVVPPVPDRILVLLPDAFIKYNVNTPLRAAHFLAQIAHESGNFTIKTESLFYSTPQRIVNVWPKRFNLEGSAGKKNANDYIRNQEKLAGAVYDNRPELGNTEPGEGFRFRGGGFLQLTGKDAYKGYANYIGKTVGETSDLLRSDDHYALDAALWEYVIDKKLNATADKGATDAVIKMVTKIVNGGYIGLEERTRLFYKYFDALHAA